MKSISAALKSHLRQDVSTLCTCLLITRRDGLTFAFTDHDVAVAFETLTYVPINSFTRTSVTATSELEVDQLEIHGILNSDAIARVDIASGIFDFAKCQMFILNYEDTTMGKLIARTGWLGECVLNEDNTFNVELRGLTQAFIYRLGDPYAPECRVDLGDRFCKIGLSPPRWNPRYAYRQGDFVFGTINAASGYINTPLVNGSFDDQINSSLLYRNATNWVTYGAANARWMFRSNLTDGGTGAAIMQAAQGTIFAVGTDNHTQDTTEVGMYQDVDLISAGVIGGELDTGLCRATFSYWALTVSKHGRVRGRLSALDADHNIIATIFDSSYQLYAFNRWFQIPVAVLIPPNTRFLRADLACAKLVSLPFAAAVDGAVLAVNSPTGNLGGADQFGGVMFQAQNSGTSGESEPAFSNLIGSTTDDNGIIWKCTPNYKEVDVVDTVTSNKIFQRTALTNPSGWYDGGLLLWETGKNAGRATEVKNYDGTTIELFLNTFYPITVGDRYVIHPGCDKRFATCTSKFSNAINFHGEPHVPGQDAYIRTPNAPAMGGGGGGKKG